MFEFKSYTKGLNVNSQKTQDNTESNTADDKSTIVQPTPEAGSHYILDGALFKCSMDSTGGTVISQLKTSNQSVFVEKKALVTDQDKTFSNPFGTCLAKPTSTGFAPCCCNADWIPDNTVDRKKNANLPTEKSKLICSAGGGQITCVFHGQMQGVTINDFSNTKIETLCFFPFALAVTFPNLNGNKPTKKASIVNNIKISKDHIRIGDEITLQAYCNTSSGQKEIKAPNFVNWVVSTTKQKEDGIYLDELMIFSKAVSPFNLKLRKPGKYCIEGGSDGMVEKYRKISPNDPFFDGNKIPVDDSCAKFLDVLSDNKITGIQKDGKDISNSGKKTYVKQGERIVFTPTFLFDFNAELEELGYSITQNKGEEVNSKDYTFDEKTKRLTFIPSAAEVDYTIKFSLHKKTEESVDVAPICEKSISVRSYNEVTLLAYVPGENNKSNNVTLRRPQESLAFTVKSKNQANEIDLSNLEWRLKKDGKYVDQWYKTKGETVLFYFRKEGKYVVEADLSKTKLCSVKPDGKALSHTFEIANNKVNKITVGTSANGKRYVGVRYPIDLSYYFGDSTLKEEKDKVELVSEGADESCLRHKLFLADSNGDYKIKAKLNSNVVESQTITLEEPTVSKWEFCDSKNKKIDAIGRNMKFGINGSVPAWSVVSNEEKGKSRKIKVSLFYKYTELCSYKTDLDDDGRFHVEDIDVEKDIIKNALNISGFDTTKDFNIYFVVYNHPSTFVKGLSTSKDGFGVKAVTSNLKITSKTLISGYFADKNGDKLVEIINYSDKAKIHLRALNITQEMREKMKVRIYEDVWGSDTLAYENKENIEIDKDGNVDVEIPIGEGLFQKPEIGEKSLPRLFYFKVMLSDPKEFLGIRFDYTKLPLYNGDLQLCVYPESLQDLYEFNVRKEMSQIQDELLKEIVNEKYDSELLHKTRNYFYMLKILSQDKNNDYINSFSSLAPVVVGEDWKKEEKEEKTTNTKCFCHRDFTVAEVKDILKKLKGDKWDGSLWSGTSKLDDKSIKKFTFELNLGFRKYGISKCIQKIAFLAIAATETGKFEKTEEGKSSFNSSKSKYKGRGLLQLTGDLNKNTKMYDQPGVYERYKLRTHNVKTDFVKNPELIAENLHYLVDSSCYYFAKYKTIPTFAVVGNDEEKSAQKKKQEMWANAIGRSLSDTSILIETEKNEDYYYLINKVLNGYQLKEIKEDPNSWKDRQDNFRLLKDAFKYNSSVCKEVELFYYPHEWHDPLDKMMSCYFSEGGHKKPYNSIFCIRETKNGKTGEYKKHPGVDLFAKVGTKVYACLSGEIVNVTLNSDTGGKIIYLRVTSPRQIDILRMRKRDYKLLFNSTSSNGPGEQSTSSDFNVNNGFTLIYMHLDDVFVQKGDYVVAGQEIGLSGRTGNAPNSLGPHLHFEIRSDNEYSPVGFKYHANPAEYFYYKQFKRETKKISIFNCDTCTNRSKCQICKGTTINNPENTKKTDYEDYSKISYDNDDLELQRKTVIELK